MPRFLLCLTLAAGALLAADALPRVDLHAHIDDEEQPAKRLKPVEITALSKKLHVRLGVLAEGGCAGDIHDDATLAAFLRETNGQPFWRGLQVYGFDWPGCLSKENLAGLDFLSSDAMIFTDRNGKQLWLWLPGVKFDDPQDFMDRYVDLNVRVLSQPIQVWASPTYLPESLQSQYDKLWTPARMKRVIDACRRLRSGPIGIQLGHAGRKGSTKVAWEGMDHPLDDSQLSLRE